MKRSKRNRVRRAFERGYQMGLTGRSSDTCPHASGENRYSWLSGWREGRTDQWDGLSLATATHKLSGY